VQVLVLNKRPDALVPAAAAAAAAAAAITTTIIVAAEAEAKAAALMNYRGSDKRSGGLK
jgi:hypothetical protein